MPTETFRGNFSRKGRFPLHAFQGRAEVNRQIPDFFFRHGGADGLFQYAGRPAGFLKRVGVFFLDIVQQGIDDIEVIGQSDDGRLQVDEESADKFFVAAQHIGLAGIEGVYHGVDEVDQFFAVQVCRHRFIGHVGVMHICSLDVQQQIGQLQLGHMQVKFFFDGLENALCQAQVFAVFLQGQGLLV